MNGKSNRQGIWAQSTSHRNDQKAKRQTQKKMRRDGKREAQER